MDQSLIKPEKEYDKTVIIIAKGAENTKKLCELSNLAVLQCGDENDFAEIAKKFKKEYPDVSIIMAGSKTNEKLINKSAKETGAVPVIPTFTQEDIDNGLTDWNNYANHKGDKHAKIVLSALSKKVAVIRPNKSPARQHIRTSEIGER